MCAGMLERIKEGDDPYLKERVYGWWHKNRISAKKRKHWEHRKKPQNCDPSTNPEESVVLVREGEYMGANNYEREIIEHHKKYTLNKKERQQWRFEKRQKNKEKENSNNPQ